MAHRRSLAGPEVLVGAIARGRSGAARNRRGKRKKGGLHIPALRRRKGPVERLRDAFDESIAGPLSARLPSKKRRRAMWRSVEGRLERANDVANSVTTVVGLAAAGSELLSAIRGAQDRGADDEDRRGSPTGAPAASGRGEGGRAREDGGRTAHPRSEAGGRHRGRPERDRHRRAAGREQRKEDLEDVG